jgi:hypothetical protein
MRLRFCLIPGLLGALAASGCGGDDGPGTTPGTDSPSAQTVNGYCNDATPDLIAAAGDPEMAVAPVAEEPVAGSQCNAVIRTYPIESASHVPVCSAVTYGTNPPSSGHHYGLFPAFNTYEHAIPRGFWVHSLEHGGVVITYSCTECASEVAQADHLRRTQPIEAACCPGGDCEGATNRILLTPDPGMPTRWAASGWGFTLTADCFEAEVFESFASLYRGQGPEQICANTYATDVSQPGPGL